MVIGFKQERKIKHRYACTEIRHKGTCPRSQIYGAVLNTGHIFCNCAELSVGIDVNDNGTAGSLFHLLFKFGHALSKKTSGLRIRMSQCQMNSICRFCSCRSFCVLFCFVCSAFRGRCICLRFFRTAPG